MEKYLVYFKEDLNAFCEEKRLDKCIRDRCYEINVSSGYIGIRLTNEELAALNKLETVVKIKLDPTDELLKELKRQRPWIK